MMKKFKATIARICTWEDNPVLTLFLVILTILVTEALINISVKTVAHTISFSIQIFIDVFLMLFVLFPLLYTLVLNPLLRQITLRRQTEAALDKSEERSRMLSESLNNITWELNADLQLIYIGSSVCSFLGHMQEEVIGLPAETFLTESSWRQLHNNLSEVFAEQQLTGARSISRSHEYELLRKDGSTVWAEMTATVFFNLDNRLARIVGTFKDITDRKQAEQALLQANILLQKTISSLNEAVFIVDTESRQITEVNSCAEIMFGYTREELLGAKTSILHLNDQMYQSFGADMLQAYGEKGYFETEFTMRRKDGSVFTSDHFATPITAANGEYLCHVSVVRDITERKQMVESLASSERFLNTIIATEPECIKLTDRDNNILMMNRAGLEMIQADSFEQIKGKCILSMITEPFKAPFMTLTEKIFQGSSGMLTFEAIGVKGRPIWLETHAVPFRNEHGEITAQLGITRDVTERHQNELALKSAYLEIAERKSFIESILANLQSGLIIIDPQQQIIMTNKYVQELTKLSDTEISGKSLADFCPAIAAQLMAGINSNEIPVNFCDTEYTIGFTCIDLKDANSAIIGSIINFRDLSEIVKIRNKVQQKERLTAMGEVVAGVAHEMRNPLFGMTTVGQILAMELNLSPQHRQLMDSFMHESRRLNNLVQDLLDGTRELKLRKKPVLMSRIIESAACICQQALHNKEIEFKWQKPGTEPQFHADPEKLEQVLVNLIHNAIEANDPGGCLEIHLESDSDNITCAVTDSGHGIQDNLMANIFDVFFTSKKSGTGMGLSISRNIAEAHGGTLAAENLPGNGARFTLQLPHRGDQP